ncbi:MAG: nucleotidyltransferase domain-containing protein [Candidatus Thermoplasmatota archaeon]
MRTGEFEEIASFLKSERDVKVAYLFGSAAKNSTGKLSDVDIALYLDDGKPKAEILQLKLRIIAKVASILRADKVDLVVMNDAPLLLNHNIIKHGRILKSDERTRIILEANILSRYLDRKPFLTRNAAETLRRAALVGLR